MKNKNLIKTADTSFKWFICLGRVICWMKFVNIITKSWFTPIIYLYLIRFKLKSPTIKLLLFSRLILLSIFFIKLLLNLKCCMIGCLCIRSGYASVSLLGLCMIIFVIYIYEWSTCWWFSWSLFNIIAWNVCVSC